MRTLRSGDGYLRVTEVLGVVTVRADKGCEGEFEVKITKGETARKHSTGDLKNLTRLGSSETLFDHKLDLLDGNYSFNVSAKKRADRIQRK